MKTPLHSQYTPPRLIVQELFFGMLDQASDSLSAKGLFKSLNFLKCEQTLWLQTTCLFLNKTFVCELLFLRPTLKSYLIFSEYDCNLHPHRHRSSYWPSNLLRGWCTFCAPTLIYQTCTNHHIKMCVDKLTHFTLCNHFVPIVEKQCQEAATRGDDLQ